MTCCSRHPVRSPGSASSIRWTVLLLVLLAPAAEPGLPFGYRGDGGGVFPDSRPPLSFDQQSGKNLLWTAPMPNWCFGFPSIAAGKVFVMSEPGWQEIFPLLLCYDAATGRELWRREVDPLPAQGLSGAEQAQVRTDYAALWAWSRQAWTALAEYRTAGAGEKAAVLAAWKARGVAFKNDKPDTSGGPRSAFSTDPAAEARELRLKELGLTLPGWWDWGMSLIGHCFPTPVCDGQRVYTVTGRHVYSCFDLEGKLLWMQALPRGKDERGCDCMYGRSPLLWGDLLLSDYGPNIRAFDRQTGALRWEIRTGAGHTVASPQLLDLDGTAILLCSVSRPIRLSDGKELPLEGFRGVGVHSPAVADEHDLIFYSGKGEHSSFADKGKDLRMPMAVKYQLRDGAVHATIAWQAPENERLQANEPPVYHRGKLYCGPFIYDALTGAVVGGSISDRGGQVHAAVPRTKHVLQVAGEHIYGLAEGRGDEHIGDAVLTVFDLAGKKVADTRLAESSATAGKAEQCLGKAGKPFWGWGQPCPFAIAGDRIYIRSFNTLYCIGER